MRLFVYGTLTDSDRVDAVLDGCPPAQYTVDERAVLEGLHRVDGEYPTVVPGGRVEGRLLSVNETALERLDQYEGVDTGLYVRISVPDANADDDSDADGSVAVYVGDPTRLGVAADVDWPAGDSFADRVRTYVTRHEVGVRRTE